jgi:hypothetical protein
MHDLMTDDRRDVPISRSLNISSIDRQTLSRNPDRSMSTDAGVEIPTAYPRNSIALQHPGYVASNETTVLHYRRSVQAALKPIVAGGYGVDE